MFEIKPVFEIKPILASINMFFDWLLPEMCILCGQSANNILPICKRCQSELPILPHHCQQCARFLPDNAYPKCGSCLNDPPAYQYTVALFPYESPINKWITQLKFQQKLYFASALGKLMLTRIIAHYNHENLLPDVIIPVPLHQKRLQERGFNQALEIARHIANQLRLSLDFQGINRKKETMSQSGLRASERIRNINDAFSISRNYSGLKIALFDDVVTTGSTVRECAKILAENGAVKIDVWCIARNG